MLTLIVISDYKKTQRALATCQFCYGEDDSPPKAAVIAMGTRCYLACTLFQELVEGHCFIVPIPHHLTMLDGDDDTWDEVRVSELLLCLLITLERLGLNHVHLHRTS